MLGPRRGGEVNPPVNLIFMFLAKWKFDNKLIHDGYCCRGSIPQGMDYIVDFGDEFIYHEFPVLQADAVIGRKEGTFRKDQVWVAYP